MSKKWQPNVDDVAHPKVADAIRTLADNQYRLLDSVGKVATQAAGAVNVNDPKSVEQLLATLQGFGALVGGSSAPVRNAQGSIVPLFSGSFSATTTDSSIDVTWSGLKVYPSDLWKQMQRFIAVPDGDQPNTGLTASTNYFFYPYYQLASQQVRFALDPAVAVANTFAHTAKSILAAQEQSGDGNIPLSSGAMTIATAATGGGSSGGGFGGSGCLRVGQHVEKRHVGLTRVETLELGVEILALDRWAPITLLHIGHATQFVQAIFSNGDSIEGTLTHQVPGYDIHESFILGRYSAMDAAWTRDKAGLMYPIRVDSIVSKVEEDDFVQIGIDSPHLFWGGKDATMLNHNVTLPNK